MNECDNPSNTRRLETSSSGPSISTAPEHDQAEPKKKPKKKPLQTKAVSELTHR